MTPNNPYPLKKEKNTSKGQRWYGGGDSRYSLPKQVSCIDCHRVVGFMGNYYDLTQAERERYHLTLMTAGQYEPAFVKYIYDIFDCSELWYSKDGVFSEKFLDYTQCIADNLSMGASAIPLVGTVISAVFDGVNAVVYESRALYHVGKGGYYALTGQETKAKTELKKAGMNQGFATLSAIGVIPGETEARMLKNYYNATQNVAKKTDNITQKLKKGS